MPASGVGDIFSFSVSLISNIALLIALTQVHGLLMRRMEQGKLSDWLRHTLLPGLLYGFVVITGMAAPVVLGPLIFDGRSIVLSLAPVFAGPTAGGIAAVMAAAYR
ncbi:MAG TPA: LytS/YhcK type 5TM receptor domain-containing protein [Candidatus Hydrogenedentes bacterium]|nr:LytS/YhcK type 5TM receptor domain-containing protein [Candidatus Hydrogenedentota bacterium]